jgi:hypothetical protein
MMFVLKIPIAGLFWIVWRAINSPPVEADGQASGGGGTGPQPRPLPPRPPRRGEHGEEVPRPPARVRARSGSVASRA